MQKNTLISKKWSLLASALFLVSGFSMSHANADGNIIIRAKSTLVAGIGGKMQVYTNGKLIFTKDINNTNYENIAINSSNLVAGAKLDIFFGNDAFVNGQDRNLLIESITFNSKTIKPTEARYDRGSPYSQATDGKDVIQGQEGLWWNGALRFTLPGNGSNPGTPPGDIALDLLKQVAYPGKLQNLKISNPLVISTNNQVVENLKISNPNGPCILVKPGVNNVTIRNNEIGPCQDDGIRINGVNNVTITHNYIHHTMQTRRGTGIMRDYNSGNIRASAPVIGSVNDGNAIEAHEANNITVRLNYIDSVTSGYASTAGNTSNITFEKNYVRNVFQDIRGMETAGKSHEDSSCLERNNQGQCIKFDGIPRIGGQMIQIADMSNQGNQGVKITCNVSDQRDANNSSVADHINLFNSQGNAQSPILIAYNKLVGANIVSDYGAAIQLGDQGGKFVRGYKNNLVNAAATGLSISGGQNITYEANKVLYTPDNRIKYPYFWMTGLMLRKQDDKAYQCNGHQFLRNKAWSVQPGWAGFDFYNDNTCQATMQDNLLGQASGLTDPNALLNEVFPECQ